MAGGMVEVRYEYSFKKPYYYVDVAILRDGRTYTAREGSRGIVIGEKEYEIAVDNMSSSRKIRKYARIPSEILLAVVSFSSKHPIPRLREGVGEVVERGEEKVYEEGNKRITERYKAYYYVYNDIDIFIRRLPAGKRAELIGKPNITITLTPLVPRQKPVIMTISGDTFYVKDTLKKLGLKWNGSVWIFKSREGVEGKASEVVEALKDVANVKVERF